MKLSDLSEVLIVYLTADFPHAAELQAFWMAFQGAMTVRNGPNKDRTMHWFHAFLLSVCCGYGGAAFTPFWLGKPTSMLSNDLNVAMCIITFCIANYMPFDLGFKLGNTLPIILVTVTFSQMFRTMGVCKFTNIAYEEFKDNPSPYYPIPVFGPILYGTLLGNMSGFFVKGFRTYLENGMPWPFQNGFFCCTLYHFFVHDQEGPIGTTLRKIVHSMPFLQGNLDDKTFAVVFVSVFMQVVGILQIPGFLGPSFSPFSAFGSAISALLRKIPKAQVNLAPEGTPTTAEDQKKRQLAASTGPGGRPVLTKVDSVSKNITDAAPVVDKKKRNRRKKNKTKEL